VLEELRSKAKELDIHFLENDSVVIGNVRFLGTTLWTDCNDFSAAEVDKAQASITDYSVIGITKWLADKNNKLVEPIFGKLQKLNNRPKKCLNYKTPYEAFEELTGVDCFFLK
jgi:hypothetical protein